MDKPFYKGSYRDDALNGPNRGWIVGSFMAGGPRKNEAVEIKYWEFKAGDNGGHPAKVSDIIECALILKGRVKAQINGEEMELKAGDYVVIAPGTPNNTIVEVLEDLAVLTVKAPSDPSAKRVIS